MASNPKLGNKEKTQFQKMENKNQIEATHHGFRSNLGFGERALSFVGK